MTKNNLPNNLEILEARLPRRRDDPRILSDSETKVTRIRDWMAKKKYGAALISRRDNFAWLTTGGDNHILKNTEYGVGHLLVTPERKYLLAYPMDGDRLQEMWLTGQNYELKTYRWYEGDPRELALSLGGKRIAADSPFPGTNDESTAIDILHEPLTDLEMDRCRWLGLQTGMILETFAQWVQPGMTEESAAAHIRSVFLDRGVELDVILLGSDERIGRFYHAMPSGKKMEKIFQVNPSARRWGLHANVNRRVSFGQPPKPVRDDLCKAMEIEARVLCTLEPGLSFSQVLEMQKQWYKEFGFPEEWKNHFQGGPTGYRLGDAGRCVTNQVIQSRQVFDWFITIHGLQVEEQTLLTDEGLEICSRGKRWPVKSFNLNNRKIELPDLWIR